MKTFFATFAAIMAAAAVIFGVYSYNKIAERALATWARAAQLAAENVNRAALDMPANGHATDEDFARFSRMIKGAKDVLNHPEFPKQLAPSLKSDIDKAKEEARSRLEGHFRTEKHLAALNEL